jgi:hypothetical protein
MLPRLSVAPVLLALLLLPLPALAQSPGGGALGSGGEGLGSGAEELASGAEGPASGADNQAPLGWDAPWVVGWSFGASSDMSREFGSVDPCRRGARSPAGEARVTLRRGVGSHLGVEAAASLARTVHGRSDCVVVAPFPPNFTGVRSTTSIRHGEADGRYLRTGVRLVGRMTSAHDTEFRLFAGAAMAPSYRVLGPTAGGAAAFGTGRFRLVLEGEGWLHAFPMATVTQEWQEGAVVSVREERFRGDWTRSWTFRAGVEVHPR